MVMTSGISFKEKITIECLREKEFSYFDSSLSFIIRLDDVLEYLFDETPITTSTMIEVL